jgi:type VI secretion system ImpM family protein
VSIWAKLSESYLSSAPSGVAAFGKVPAMGDFVRVNMGSEPPLELERWVTRSMELGAAALSPHWDALGASRSALAFLRRGSGSGRRRIAMVGVAFPSRDAVGRRFPLVLCSPVGARELGGAVHLVPLMVQDFVFAAAEVAASASNLTLASLTERLRTVPIPAPDPAAAETSYAEWSARTTLGALAQALSVTQDTLAHMVKTVVWAVEPLRGAPSASARLGLRLPVAGASVHVTAFWIDLVRRRCKWKETLPSLAWPAAPALRSAVVQLGDETPLSLLVDAWDGGQGSDRLCDPGRAPAENVPGMLSEGVGADLSRPTTSVEALLGGLAG